jgi:hypothetical protein
MILMVHPEFGALEETRARVEQLGYRVDLAGSDHRPVLQAWRRGSGC